MIESIKIDTFYRKFNHSGKNNFPELSRFKKHQKVDKKKYKAIVKKYLSVYLNEVYFIDRPFYFLFGGLIMKVRCGNWIRDNPQKTGYEIAGHSIGLFWYQRPCPRFWFSIDLRKMKGSSNVIPKIESEWKKENDITALPLSRKVKKKLREQFKLFKAIRK